MEHALNDVQHHSYLGSITHGFAVDSHCEQYNRKYRMYYFISTFQLVEIKTARTKQKHRRSWAQFCCKMWEDSLVWNQYSHRIDTEMTFCIWATAGVANLWRMRQIWRIGWFEVAHCIPVIVIKKVSLSNIFIDFLLRTNPLWDACYHLERNFEDLIKTLHFAVRKCWYQLASVFKGADWICCWQWQFEKMHCRDQIIARLIWKSLLWFC